MEALFTLALQLIGAYLLFNVLVILVSTLAGWLGKADDIATSTQARRLRRIAVLIPAYKEDKVILDSVQVNLQQNYPAELYDIFVIADSFKAETLEQLAHYPVKTIVVEFEKSTVSKSITYALNAIPEDEYEIVVVSDADNHMATDFLQRINLAFDNGWRAVQGHRVAKNTNTSVAIFDAMNEEVNNHIFRAGQRALGTSSALIGSGMAFEPRAMKHAMNQIRTMGGYDKELEMNLLVEGIKIGYLKDAYIYDEKVQNLEVFERQRTRWIAAQIQFVSMYFRTAVGQLVKGNLSAVIGYVKQLILPRTIFLATLMGGLLGGLVTGNMNILASSGIMLTVLMGSLVGSIPAYLWSKLSLGDLLTFPRLVFRMMNSLVKYKIAKSTFLPTPHGEETTQKAELETAN